MTFQIAFCYFSSDSPEFLHLALNSFRKPCSNVLYPVFALHLQIKKHDYGHDFRFYHKTFKRKVADKTLQQRFLKEFKATCKNSIESELKQKTV